MAMTINLMDRETSRPKSLTVHFAKMTTEKVRQVLLPLDKALYHG